MELVDKYWVQGVAIAEHGTNFSHFKLLHRLASWFNALRQVKVSEA